MKADCIFKLLLGEIAGVIEVDFSGSVGLGRGAQ